MRKAIFVLLTIVCVWIAGSASAGADEPFLGTHESTAYLPQTPGVTGGPVGAFANPASWATSNEGGLDFWWSDRSIRRDALDNWGFSTGRNLGFAMQRSVLPDGGDGYSLYDYQAGIAGGDRRGHLGLAWRWSGGRSGRVGRENSLVAGAINRPNRYVSYGLSGVFSTGSDARLGLFDLGIRPFGKSWITLFGDYSLADDQNLDTGQWGAGFEVRPWRGIHLGMKMREADGADDYSYSLNLGLTLDGSGFHVLPGYDQDGNRGATSYLVRAEPPYRGLPVDKAFRKWFAKPFYVKLDLENKRITYQKARWFEKGKVAWIDLARRLDRIKEEPSVRGVAINLAGTGMGASIGWEFREKLIELKKAGKEVIVHIDDTSFGYYVASAADHLSIDPVGGIQLTGLAVHRTYMRGLFDKLGVGVEEWRFFTHKSAFEGFTRTDMSDADREQIGRLVDVIYETVRDGVCESRGFDAGTFDALVDEQACFTARTALEKGLVDTVARWDDLGDWLKENREGAKLAGLPYDRDHGVYSDEPWGRPKELALVYALGVCAMDEGIRGRATSEYMRKLAKNRDVAAVVLRADSPGGGALPSDLIAEATTKLKEAEKPVVVSQGNVAGSGGYWISMNGSRILTTPVTVTGSIGVIGGWFWDTGIGEKTGFSADGVQRGKHSDLFTGIRFPGLGTLPTRNLDDEEKGMMKNLFFDLYGDFVDKVAAGRGLTEEKVREVGEGRIWMGEDAIGHGLCDQIGGLQDALAEAKSLAGIDPDDEVILSEYPERPRFRFPKMGGGPFGMLLSPVAGWIAGGEEGVSGEEESYDLIYLRSIAGAEGRPMVLTPPEAVPAGWTGTD